MKLMFLFSVLSMTFIGTLSFSFEDCGRKPRLTTNVQRVSSPCEKHGCVIETRCHPDHIKTRGNHNRTCLDGRWTGYPLECRPDTDCLDPGSMVGGRRQGMDFYIGSTVKFSCGSGFILEGEAELKCIKGKNWSAPLPSCKREISCANFTAVANAQAEAKKKVSLPGYSPGDGITYTCNDGHLVDGEDFEDTQTITCLSNGIWDTQELKKCTPVKCSPPETTSHLLINPEKEIYEYGDKVAFSCEEGYQIKGLPVVTCVGFEEWDLWSPTCEVIRCPDPGRPDNARRIGNTFYIGDNVTFVCSDGYVMKGSEDRTCLSTRQWSGELTICDTEASDCPDPGIPIGSTKDGSDYNFGDSVTYVCDDEDFIQVGNTTRFCLSNGEWSGRDDFCQYRHGFDDPTKAGLLFADKLGVLSTVTSDSEVGGYFRENKTLPGQSNARALNLNDEEGLHLYLVIDVSGSIDNESLAITKRFCKAIVNKVGVSDKRDGTNIFLFSFSNEVKQILTDQDEQTPEYVNSKIDEMQTTGHGATALNAALKTVYNHVGTSKYHGDKSSRAAIIITDGKHNLRGDPTPTALELQSDYNVDMYAIGVGTEVDIGLLKDIAKDNQYMRLKTMEDLNDVIHMVANNDTTVERYGECGVGGLKDVKYSDIDKYQEATTITNWPWMAGLYFKSNTKFNFACGATLINSEWLLSAAHCFVHEDAMELKNWKVKFGDIERGIDKGVGITFYIKEIIKHPNYTRKPHQLHDLVLLRLHQPMKFTANIRPICLPDQITQYLESDFQGDWYKPPKKTVIVTGWGGIKAHGIKSQNNVKLSEILKYIAMPQQTDDKCKASVPAGKTLKYEGIFCAGNGAKLDACKGDSGGPIVSEVKLKDTTKRIFQIGIVSFGYGCSQDDRYGYYVRLEDYMDWIRKVAKETDQE